VTGSVTHTALVDLIFKHTILINILPFEKQNEYLMDDIFWQMTLVSIENSKHKIIPQHTTYLYYRHRVMPHHVDISIFLYCLIILTCPILVLLY
jgi:hypothetical protein